MRRVMCDIINSDGTFQSQILAVTVLRHMRSLRRRAMMALFSMSICPGMDGLQLLEQLQKDRIRATVIMVSTTTTKDADVTIRAMERGAVDFVTKPTNVIEAKGEEFKNSFSTCSRRYARPRVTIVNGASHRRLRLYRLPAGTAKPVATAGHAIKSGSKIVALACSTGGPKALQSVIPYLPKNLDAPMVLVQHMPAGFTKSMADRLDEVSPIHVKEAEDGDVLMKGTVYIAPGGKHMEVKRQPDGSHRIRLNDMPAIGGLKPCQHHVRFPADCGYDQVVCVVLTGMGADGTKGLFPLPGRSRSM